MTLAVLRISSGVIATLGLLAIASCASDPPSQNDPGDGGTDGSAGSDVTAADSSDASAADGDGGAAEVGSDSDRDDAPPVGMGDHGVYEALIARAELHHQVSLRSQVEIDDNLHGRVMDPPSAVYDPLIDAARLEVHDGGGSVAQQMRIPFDRVSTGNLLLYWEGRWEQGFASDGDIDGVQTQKAYQIARQGSGDNRRIEPRTRFSQVSSPFVAAVDTRVYHFTPAVGDSQPLEPQTGTFSIRPETWTRFWAFVDFDNDRYSYWVADETTTPQLIHDAVGLDYSNFPNGNEGLDWFWFEHNSSQSRTAGTPILHIWGRNFVVLRDVTDAPSIVAQYVP